MLFNSYIFLIFFLPFVFFCFYFFKKKNQNAKLILIFSSLVFYSYYNIFFLPLILFSILVNYYLLKNFFNTKKKLVFQIFFNIFILVFFKYLDFLIEKYNILFQTNLEYLNLPFPLALSFFTFQQIAFIVDFYNNKIKLKILDYFFFIIFFPQLIAGPIILYDQISKQINYFNRNINYKNIYIGLTFFFIGLFKKTVIADSFAFYANQGFDNYERLDFFQSWIISLSWTFQFYFDFSGYVDMAIGLALLFNIKIPFNFNSPYKSLSLIDFWKRWHMTLGNFVQNYMYYPILKSFKKLNFFKSMLSLLIIMTLIGFWHGANDNFIIFGFLHGLGLIINYSWKKYNFQLNKFTSWFLTFNYINLTFIIFRSNNIGQAIDIIKSMFFLNGIYLPFPFENKLNFLSSSFFVNKKILSNFDLLTSFFMIIFAFYIVLFLKNSNKIFNYKLNPYLLAIIGLIGILFVNSKEFIYFKY